MLYQGTRRGSRCERRCDDGFTLAELLVALTLTLVVVGAALSIANPAQMMFSAQPEVLEMQQRLRVSAGPLMSDLLMAGAGLSFGPDSGSLARACAAIVPRRVGQRGDAPDAARQDAITIRYVPVTFAETTTTSAVPGPGLTVAGAPNCPAGRALCGIQAGMDVIVFDQTGHCDVFSVTRVQAGAAELAPHSDSLTHVYAPGAVVAQAESRSYYFDAANGQLRRYDGRVTDVPVADHVVGFTVEYFGDPAPPVEPRPPLGTENCLYESDGDPKPLPMLTGAAGGVAPLPIEVLRDGPWCGSGGSVVDADALRIREVRVSIRVQAASPELRGAGPEFARPGTSRSSYRYVPDAIAAFRVAPRNLRLAP